MSRIQRDESKAEAIGGKQIGFSIAVMSCLPLRRMLKPRKKETWRPFYIPVFQTCRRLEQRLLCAEELEVPSQYPDLSKREG
jgi:hypothetical protein